MPPRRRSASGYRGVRERPNGTFYAEIRSADERIGLGTFETAHEAARAYDAVAWRLGRSRRSMNFHDVWSRAQAEALAPPPRLVTEEERHRRLQTERRLLAAERDERLMAEWASRFPQDVAAQRQHDAAQSSRQGAWQGRSSRQGARQAQRQHEASSAQAAEDAAVKAAVRASKHDERQRRRAEKVQRRAFIEAQLVHRMIPPDDPRWKDLWALSPVSDTTPSSSDFDWSDSE